MLQRKTLKFNLHPLLRENITTLSIFNLKVKTLTLYHSNIWELIIYNVTLTNELRIIRGSYYEFYI